jgi:hypothetical protein
MPEARTIALRDLLHAALRQDLPEGWVYLPKAADTNLSTTVLLIENVKRKASPFSD